MPDKQPSFAARAAAMHDAALELKRIAESIALEAIRMDAAQTRFSERRTKRKEAR